MKVFLLISTLFAAGFLTALPSHAQVAPECSNLHNSPGACQESPAISIKKQIQNPVSGKFVDSLGVDAPLIRPGSNLVFRITITNISSRALENINLTDIIPNAFENVRPQKGEYNPDNSTLSYHFARLEPEASDSLDIQATLRSADALPSIPVCLVNIATARSGSFEARDNVQLCVGSATEIQPASAETGQTSSSQTPASQAQTTKGGKEVASASNASSSPNTGPGLVSLLALIPTALGGFYLRKKSR